MFKPKPVVFLLAAIVGGCPYRASGQRVVADGISCASCRIQLDTVSVLARSGDSIGFTYRSHVGIDSKSRFIVAPTFVPGQTAVFDSQGRFQGALGRAGPGPDEISGDIDFVLIGRGDTIHVISRARTSLIAPTFERIHEGHTLPGHPQAAVVLPNGEMLMQFPVYVAGVGSRLIHRISQAGEMLASIEEPLATENPLWARVRTIALADGGRALWSAPVNTFRIKKLALDGDLLDVIVRAAPWFPDWDTYERGEPWQRRPRPRVSDLLEAGGVLWAFISVADAQWIPREAAGDNRRTSSPRNPSDAYDTVIEAIDIQRGTVLARQRFVTVVRPTGNGPTVYSYAEQPDGELDLILFRLRLIR